MNASFYISDKSHDNHYEIMFETTFENRELKKLIWIRNSGYEGMRIEEQKFFELVDNFFKENF